MIDSTAKECLLFPDIFAKPVIVEFDQRQGSSDGGAVLLKAAERRCELIASMSGCLRDPLQAGKVDHSLRDPFAQRVFSIGSGYADANDSARSPLIRCTRCCSTAIRLRSSIWLRSRRCRVLKMPSARASFITWAQHWRECDRTSCATAAPSRSTGHYRSRSERRSHA